MELNSQIVLSSLKKRDFKPIYFLMGEESYYIDQISDWIVANVLPEEDQDFNQLVLYGKDTTLDNVIMTARAFPITGNLQLVIVKEAQQIKSYDDLIHYVKQPQMSTILVFCYKYGCLDKRKYKTLITEMEKVGVVFQSDKVRENYLPAKVMEIAANLGVVVDNRAANVLASFLGTDLSKIASELAKLKLAVSEKTTITPEIIERNVGISKDYNAFELTNALASKNVKLAMQIVDYCGKDKLMSERIPLVISAIYSFFSNMVVAYGQKDRTEVGFASNLGMNPYAAKHLRMAMNLYSEAKAVRIIDYIREADGACKGLNNVSMSAQDVLSILVFKILH